MGTAVRLGLVCKFREQPIRFRTSTAAALLRLPSLERAAKLSGLCAANAEALTAAIEFCAAKGIGCFRIGSQILPLKTHPAVGYELANLPEGRAIMGAFERCGRLARRKGVRLCFHPDQFVVLSSPRENVVERSIAELDYQAEVAQWVSADVINVHAGGGYGDKREALNRFRNNYKRLSRAARRRLTVENDDCVYAPTDLLPICEQVGLPLVYDVHHHRCLSDGLTIEEATRAALATWNREPLFHVSSPLGGWGAARPAYHADFISPADLPASWRALAITVEVEAKAKELAVLDLMRQLDATSFERGSKPAHSRLRSRA
ncbi:MAG TPA: UV DNA damage repair endonuclease UvsE [Pirellulales bacterium]